MENMQGLTVNGRCSCIFIGDAQCRFLWEKEIREGDEHMLMCLEAVNICMDDEHLTSPGTFTKITRKKRGYENIIHFWQHDSNSTGLSLILFPIFMQSKAN